MPLGLYYRVSESLRREVYLIGSGPGVTPKGVIPVSAPSGGGIKYQERKAESIFKSHLTIQPS